MWLATTSPSVCGTLLRTLSLCFVIQERANARSFRMLPDMVVVNGDASGSASLRGPGGEPAMVRSGLDNLKEDFEKAGAAPLEDRALLSSDEGVNEGYHYEWISLDEFSADKSRCRREVASGEWTLFRFPDLRSGTWRLGKIKPSRMIATYVLDGIVLKISVSNLRWNGKPMLLCFTNSTMTTRRSRSLTQDSVVQPKNITCDTTSSMSSMMEDEEVSSDRNSSRQTYIVIIVAVIGSLTVMLFVVITVVVRLVEKKSSLVSGAKTRDIQCTF